MRLRTATFIGARVPIYYTYCESFAFVLQTYSVNKQVPDAASSATAMFTGVKVNQKTIGLDANYNHNDATHCRSDNPRRIGLESLATWAQAAGKNTGKISSLCLKVYYYNSIIRLA